MLVEFTENKKHIYFEDSEDFITCVIENGECLIEFEKCTGKDLHTPTVLYEGSVKKIPVEFKLIFKL